MRLETCTADSLRFLAMTIFNTISQKFPIIQTNSFSIVSLGNLRSRKSSLLVATAPTVVGRRRSILLRNQSHAWLTRKHDENRCSLSWILFWHWGRGQKGFCALLCWWRRSLVACKLCTMQKRASLGSASSIELLS